MWAVCRLRNAFKSAENLQVSPSFSFSLGSQGFSAHICTLAICQRCMETLLSRSFHGSATRALVLYLQPVKLWVLLPDVDENSARQADHKCTPFLPNCGITSPVSKHFSSCYLPLVILQGLKWLFLMNLSHCVLGFCRGELPDPPSRVHITRSHQAVF